jgi:hypothetical protein
MSIHAKDFRLPLKAKDGAFYLQVELRHENWAEDIQDVRTEVHDITRCKHHVDSVTLTDWVCYDEEGTRRGVQHDLSLDITQWFMGLKGPVLNAKISGIGFAHVINQLPTVRTPWVKDVRMDVKLTIKYTPTML